MPFDINWDLTHPVDIGGQAVAGFDRGQAIRAQYDTRRALSDFQANPDSSRLNSLMALNPELAMQAGRFQQQRDEAARAARFRAAHSRYVLAGEAAQGAPRASPLAPPVLQPGPAQPLAPPGSPVNMMVPDGLDMPTAPPGAAPSAPSGGPAEIPGLAEQTAAFREMALADPVAAEQARHVAYANVADHLKSADDAYDWAIARLANVTDEASYQTVLSEAHQRFAPLGVDLGAMVPPHYPGPEGTQQLLMSALGAKEQLGVMNQQVRLAWDIQDDKLDNVRADREAASRETDRTERRKITMRGQDKADARARERAARVGQRQPPAATPSRVVGRIMDKYARGEALTPQEQEILDNGTTTGRRRQPIGRDGGGGVTAPQPRAGPGASKANPVRVTSPVEAEKLPSGTWYTAPGLATPLRRY
jgi:hypothetical protein